MHSVLSFVVLTTTIWCVSGALKRAGYLDSGDSRKINHIFAFCGGAIWFGWLPESEARTAVRMACGILLALVVVVCLLRRYPPFLFAFLGNTRESDAPYEAFYFWFSWSISMLALFVIDLVFAEVVVTRTAALLVGIGDGLAEPIGTRFGRHRYATPTIFSCRPRSRSVEGSVAVVAGSFATVVCCFAVYPSSSTGQLLLSAAIVALATGAVEALSPHGLDNLTIPLSSAVLLRALVIFDWL